MLVVIAIVIVSIPLIETGTVDFRGTGLTAVGFAIAGIIIAIITALFVKPGTIVGGNR